MDLQEAKELAALIKQLPKSRVLGIQRVEGDVALVFRIGRKRMRTTSANSFAKIAQRAELVGHAFEKLNLCTECYQSLRANDGHYHQLKDNRLYPRAICCKCRETVGGIPCEIYRRGRVEKRRKVRRVRAR